MEIILVVNPIHFIQSAIYLLGSFPVAKTDQYQFLVVVVDYFTQMVEAEPFA